MIKARVVCVALGEDPDLLLGTHMDAHRYP